MDNHNLAAFIAIIKKYGGDIAQYVTDWLDEHVDPETGYVIDNTLTIQGAAADAKAVGDAIDDIISTKVLNNAQKNAILACFRNVAWINDEGQTYYSALQYALYPVEEIIATFTQGNNIITATDSLDDLRNYLVVTAQMEDGTSETVAEYSLSGTLSSSNSVITVSCLGKTTTFTVNVKQLPNGYTQNEYVLSDTSQLIKTDINEEQMGSYAIRYKAMPIVSDITVQHNMHMFSSLNWFSPTMRFLANKETGSAVSMRWGGTQTYVQVLKSNEIYVVEAYKNVSDVITINRSNSYTCPLGETYNANNKLYLLGYSGVADSETKFRFVGRTYYFKLYDSATGAKVHDFMPCTDPNNVVGFYDLVTDTFLPPAFGTLIAG